MTHNANPELHSRTPQLPYGAMAALNAARTSCQDLPAKEISGTLGCLAFAIGTTRKRIGTHLRSAGALPRHTLLILVAAGTTLALVTLSLASSDVECGDNSPTMDMDDTYGPMYSQTSAVDACRQALNNGIFPYDCEDCPPGQAGCTRATVWADAEETCECDVHVIPNVTPTTWIATYNCHPNAKGWVSCSQCDQ